MKRHFQFLVFALTFAAPIVVAADKPNPEEARERLQQIADQLDLTEEQKASIRPILQKQGEELKAVLGNSALNRRHKLRRAREINEDATSKIRALLTPEQQVKFDELREETKAKMRQRLKERRQENG